MTVRWRLLDPGEQGEHYRPGRVNWTRVHVESVVQPEVTTCGLPIPEHAYVLERDDEIPAEAEACRRCAPARRLAHAPDDQAAATRG